jgi:hypothetical protein
MTRIALRPSVVAMSNTSANSRSARSAGHACAVGAALTVVLAATTQAVQTDTDIPTHQWSYPWWSQAAVLFYLLAAGGQALLAVGIVGLRRRGVVGASRAGSLGLAAALAGTVLLVIGELASIPIRHELVDDGWPRVVESVFGVGTVLTAVGFLLAGAATMRSGVWRDWRRFTPLAVGIWSVALIGLQFTPALPAAVGVYGLCFLAIGIALGGVERRSVAEGRPEAQRA